MRLYIYRTYKPLGTSGSVSYNDLGNALFHFENLDQAESQAAECQSSTSMFVNVKSIVLPFQVGFEHFCLVKMFGICQDCASLMSW